MFVAEQAPYDSNVFNNNYKRYCTQRANNTAHKSKIAESVDAERLDSAYEIQIKIDSGNEAAQRIKRLADWYWIECRQINIRCGEWQCEPAVQGQRQAKS